MPFNGSGVFQRVRNWVADATSGIKIRADYHDAEDDGFAAGLSNTITKDGQTLITQNIPFNSKRITGLADAINPQDAATKAYVDTKAPLAGGVLTGDLQIKKANATITLNSQGGANTLSGLVNDKQRWLFRLGNGAGETGGNAGSDLDIHRYGDGGEYLGRVLEINRANGQWIMSGVIHMSDLYVDGGGMSLGGWGGNGNNAVLFMNSARSAYLYHDINGFSFTDKLAIPEPSAGNHAATVNYVNGRTAFTPVQQGGGAYQWGSKIYIGWDGGRLRAQVDGTDLGQFYFGDPPGIPGNLVNDGRLAFCSNHPIAAGGQGGMENTYEPYGGAVVTGWSWTNAGGFPYMNYFKLRWVQLRTSDWYTVGYV
jgi:hypothetical protein